MSNFDRINDYTGFANGAAFDGPEHVRSYFTVENIESMIGEGECPVDQDTLDAWADDVIENRWHMTAEYQLAFADCNGDFNIVETFTAAGDDEAYDWAVQNEERMEQQYNNSEWYILHNGKNINA